MATTTYFGWETPDDTDLVKDGAAAIRTLGSAIDSSMSQLEGGTTGQILSKTSATDMAFTWTTPNPGDITAVTAGTGISGGGTSGDVTVTNSMATAITTAGDLIKGTGSGTFNRLGIGSTGQVLTVASGAPAWAAATGGMSAYTSWTPILDQGASTNIATTGNQAYYATSGEFVHAYGYIGVNGAGTASGIIGFSVPIAPNVLMNSQSQIGTGGVYDGSAALMYPGFVYRYTASRFALQPSNAATGPSFLGASQMTAALAAGDGIYFNFVYRS